MLTTIISTTDIITASLVSIIICGLLIQVQALRGRDCGTWQYSWAGKISGIIGDVDMNYMYDDIVTSKTSTKANS